MLMSEIIREQFGKEDDKRDAGLTPPEDVVRFKDILYGQDKEWNVLDVYRPKSREGEILPVIISVHGGGWVYGDKERYQFYCMSLVQHGFAVVNFTYRLAPEYQFPASLEDTNEVFHWVENNAEKYAFDTKNIFAVGDSAGAHLLGIYANVLTNKNFAQKFKLTLPAIRLRAVALNCGQYEIILDENTDDTTKALMAELLPKRGSKEELDCVNVVRHVTSDFPPTYLMTSNGDFLQAQAPLMVHQFMKKQVPFEFHFYGDKEKELLHVFQCSIKLPEAGKCNKEECDFFKKYIIESNGEKR